MDKETKDEILALRLDVLELRKSLIQQSEAILTIQKTLLFILEGKNEPKK